MKVIFLDIDGVLNNTSCCGSRPVHKRFAKGCIEAFNEIVAATEADIVISSTWRICHSLDNLIDILRSIGIKGNIIGKTPIIRYSGAQRGDEILRWLDRESEEICKKINTFVILDDDADMSYLKDYLIECDPETGLTKEKAKEAVEMLNYVSD
jgi:hypothetical protein